MKGGEHVALTLKQERFVAEYLVDLNATQAAIRAGYSAKNADKIGPELLGKTRVSEALQAAIKERSERTRITQEQVIEEIGRVAFAEAADYADAALKYANKLKALELLGKHLGMFTDKVEHSGTVNTNPFAGLTTEELRKLAGGDG